MSLWKRISKPVYESTIGRALYRSRQLLLKPWSKSVDKLPYELLASQSNMPLTERYSEFVRRLKEPVFWAAQDFVERSQSGIAPQSWKTTAEGTVESLFRSFAPKFGAGDARLVLRQFAAHLVQRLDTVAFQRIRQRYYEQLPLYHVPSGEQRRYLAVAHALRLARTPEKTLTERVAQRLGDSPLRTEAIIQRANKSLRNVLRYEYTDEIWRNMSDGVLKRP